MYNYQYMKLRRGYTITARDDWAQTQRRTTFASLRVGDTFTMGDNRLLIKVNATQAATRDGSLTEMYDEYRVEYFGPVSVRHVDAFTRAYLECAEWADADEDQIPEGYEGFSAESIAEAFAECIDFQRDNAKALAATGASDEQHGHDFWLTRNGHGAGFWDRGYPGKLGKHLTDKAHVYGERYVTAYNGKLFIG